VNLTLFDTRAYDRAAFEAANAAHGHAITFQDVRLTPATAVLAAGSQAVCAFVNDQLDREVLESLASGGTRLLALRSAGYNHVDLAAAREQGLAVVRVPAYSPAAVAEHAVALLLCLNRKVHRAYARVREGNFELEGLVGFDLAGKTVGVVGTGGIGSVFARIMRGFGCRVLAHDAFPTGELGVTYVDLDTLLATSDVISLHVPLTPATTHLIDAGAIARLKRGAILVNTSRGAVIDTPALIDGLKSGQVGGAGLDVYEGEAGLFFGDHSHEPLLDDVLARLLTFPNVLITGHQAFLTREALHNIAETTLANVSAFEQGKPLTARVPEDRR
jgi:D-lactate dehydrogenase